LFRETTETVILYSLAKLLILMDIS